MLDWWVRWNRGTGWEESLQLRLTCHVQQQAGCGKILTGGQKLGGTEKANDKNRKHNKINLKEIDTVNTNPDRFRFTNIVLYVLFGARYFSQFFNLMTLSQIQNWITCAFKFTFLNHLIWTFHILHSGLWETRTSIVSAWHFGVNWQVSARLSPTSHCECVHAEQSAGLLKWIKWSKWGLWRRMLCHYSEWYSCCRSLVSTPCSQKWSRRTGGVATWAHATLLQHHTSRALVAGKLLIFQRSTWGGLNKHSSQSQSILSVSVSRAIVGFGSRARKNMFLHFWWLKCWLPLLFHNPPYYVCDFTRCWNNVGKVPQ